MTKQPPASPENDPLTDILSQLKDVPTPSEARIAAAKDVFLNTAKHYRSEKALASLPFSPFKTLLVLLSPKRKAFYYAIVLLLGLIFSSTGVVYAADQAIPGDALYTIDLALEQISINMASTPEGKTERLLNTAQERLDEITALIEDQKIDNLPIALINYQEKLETLTALPDAPSFAENIHQQSMQLSTILALLSTETQLANQETLEIVSALQNDLSTRGNEALPFADIDDETDKDNDTESDGTPDKLLEVSGEVIKITEEHFTLINNNNTKYEFDLKEVNEDDLHYIKNGKFLDITYRVQADGHFEIVKIDGAGIPDSAAQTPEAMEDDDEGTAEPEDGSEDDEPDDDDEDDDKSNDDGTDNDKSDGDESNDDEPDDDEPDSDEPDNDEPDDDGSDDDEPDNDEPDDDEPGDDESDDD